MARKAWLLSLVSVVILSLGVMAIDGFSKDKKQYSEEKDIDVISEKIDEVLKNQQDIIARLEDIRAQQDIIRVRASRN